MTLTQTTYRDRIFSDTSVGTQVNGTTHTVTHTQHGGAALRRQEHTQHGGAALRRQDRACVVGGCGPTVHEDQATLTLHTRASSRCQETHGAHCAWTT